MRWQAIVRRLSPRAATISTPSRSSWRACSTRSARCCPEAGRADAIRRERHPMKTILLIEDNELNRDMLSRRLQKRGYLVVAAVVDPDGCESARYRWLGSHAPTQGRA